MEQVKILGVDASLRNTGLSIVSYNNELAPDDPNAFTGFKPAPATSDIDSKKEIDPGEDEINDFLNNLGTYSYEYKDKQYGEGRRISPMAQEIEKSPLGKIAISTNKEGYKQVDYGKLGGTMLAALAMQNKRINSLQEQIKKAVVANVSAKKKGK